MSVCSSSKRVVDNGNTHVLRHIFGPRELLYPMQLRTMVCFIDNSKEFYFWSYTLGPVALLCWSESKRYFKRNVDLYTVGLDFSWRLPSAFTSVHLLSLNIFAGQRYPFIWWLVELPLWLFLPFCSKVLRMWKGPTNDILSICECSF